MNFRGLGDGLLIDKENVFKFGELINESSFVILVLVETFNQLFYILGVEILFKFLVGEEDVFN